MKCAEYNACSQWDYRTAKGVEMERNLTHSSLKTSVVEDMAYEYDGSLF